MTNEKLDAIKARNRAAFATDDTGSRLRAYHLDVKTLLAEVDRLNGEAEEHRALLKRILVDNKKMDTALRKALAVLYGQHDRLCDPDGRPSNG